MEVTSNNLLKTAAGVIPHEYGIREDGVQMDCLSAVYRPGRTLYLLWKPGRGRNQQDGAGGHRENVEVLLPRAGEIWDLP